LGLDYASPYPSIERLLVKIVAHGSPSVLEAELLDRVAAVKAGDPLAPLLIVVPTRRLADHLTHRLAARFGSILGVDVLHHRGLAERMLESAGAAPKHLLGEELLATLFATVIERAPSGRLRDFVRDHPGAASALRKTLTDLREAGIDPSEASAMLKGSEAETAALFARWSVALDELAARGAVDEAGLVRAATAEAATFAASYSHIWHHGAYDLIDVHVKLVRALDRGRELTFLLPADPVDAVGSFGVARARAIAASPASITPIDRQAARPQVAFLHAQGARAELQTAAYEALAAVDAGTPPHEIAILVRSFGPYAAALDALLRTGEPLWNTSYTRPLRSDPSAGSALRAIETGPDTGPCGFRAHADAFESAAEGSAPSDALSGLFQSMREVETILGDDRRIPRGEALAWLDQRLDVATILPDGAAGAGVRILDAMQARGLTFSQVGLVGLNAGIFPRVAREDPFLSDASRLRLRETLGRALPISAESSGEERLLVAMVLGATRDRLRVSWRRSDDSARPIVASLALGDIARFANVGSDAMDVERAARALPAHPRAKLEAWAHRPGLLDRRDETLLAALASETGADAGPAVAARRPECASGIALVAATESFDPKPGRYDGRIGVSARHDSVTATALERLGRCPLQFFFRDVLRIDGPKTPPTPFEADAASVGSRVHDVLRQVYTRLRDEGAFKDDAVGARVVRARQLLREAWSATAGDNDPARAERLPVLLRIEDAGWLHRLDAFLDADLRRIASDGLVPEALEKTAPSAIPGGPPGLVVGARFDRVLRGRASALVSDYKTGGELTARVKPGAMLAGGAMQVPIYALLSGASVELLGVGPRHDPVNDVVRFDGFTSSDQREGFLETLRVLIALVETGRFPIHPGDHCDWCDYRSACRHGHPPTLFREEQTSDVQDARDCWSKTVKAPTLAAVRREDTP
jgi:RecB family exonuclease